MKPLQGKSVALAEGRQLEELADLLQAEGATVLRCPLLSILDAPDVAAVEAWLRDFVANRFALVIVMTGEALRRIAGVAQKIGLHAEYVQALGRVPLLVRGPKPIKSLREMGVDATCRTASTPTTQGVILSLREQNLAGVRVGLTLYGHDNPTLMEFLRDAGAEVHTVLSYVFAPAADDDRVGGLIDRMAEGDVDALVFTSSPQVVRIFEVAERRGLQEHLRKGLERVTLAAVGPLVAEALQRVGARVDVCPEQGWVMKNLVRQLVRHLS